MSDETPETPADTAAVMANWIVVLTSLALIGSIFIVLEILKDQYQRGMLA
jgi:hypothetical protein